MATTTASSPHLASFPQQCVHITPRPTFMPLPSRPLANSIVSLPAVASRSWCNYSETNQRRISCRAAEVSVSEQSSIPSGEAWVPVVPLSALPKGERRVVVQDGATILLLWYKDTVYAVENRSPAEGAYSEGLINAKLTQDGCIVCPTTDSTFELQTGAIKDWYPKNPVLRFLTPALRGLYVYPLKKDEENIYIRVQTSFKTDASAEIIFSGKAQPGMTASDVNVDEVRMVVDENVQGFGFTSRTEMINGKAAVIGLLLVLDFELLTGKGLLKGTGILDFIYSISNSFN